MAKNSQGLGKGMGGAKGKVTLPTPNRAATPKPGQKPAAFTPAKGQSFPQMDSGRKK